MNVFSMHVRQLFPYFQETVVVTHGKKVCDGAVLKEGTVSHPDSLGLSFCSGSWSSADAVSQQHSALLRCLTHPVWYEYLRIAIFI